MQSRRTKLQWITFLPSLLIGGIGWAYLQAEPEERQDEAELKQIGKETFQNTCTKCHFIPDPTIRRDQLWLKLIETTP